MKQISATITEGDYEFLKGIGGGVLSRGIRVACMDTQYFKYIFAKELLAHFRRDSPEDYEARLLSVIEPLEEDLKAENHWGVR